MNPKLKKAKTDIRNIEYFCNGRPFPTEIMVLEFLEKENLNNYKKFAIATHQAVWEREFHFFTNKINKSRV